MIFRWHVSFLDLFDFVGSLKNTWHGGFWDFDWPSPIKIPMVFFSKIWIGTWGDFDGKNSRRS